MKNELKDHLTKVVEILTDLEVALDLLERERDLLLQKNTDLRRTLKRLKPIGRIE